MMGGGGWGTSPTITQDATTLTVEYQSGGQNPTPQKFVVKTDGSESKNSVSRGGQTTEQVSKATWDGNKLVVTSAGELRRHAARNRASPSRAATSSSLTTAGMGGARRR